MATFLTVLLVVSIIGLVSLLAVKRWELSSGRVMMGSVRPAAGRMLGTGLHFVERRAPAMISHGAQRGYTILKTVFHRTVAWSVLHVERMLERTLHTLRHRTAERGEEQPSAFLREVAEHKKSLINRSSKKKNAIYEE